MMTPRRFRTFFDAWNDHDVETIVSYFTPDGAYYASIGPEDSGTAFSGTAFRGTDELRRGVAALLGTYGDVHYTDLEMGMAGERAFASWTFHGTSPDVGPMTSRGVDLFELDGDRIRVNDVFRKERSRPIGG